MGAEETRPLMQKASGSGGGAQERALESSLSVFLELVRDSPRGASVDALADLLKNTEWKRHCVKSALWEDILDVIRKRAVGEQVRLAEGATSFAPWRYMVDPYTVAQRFLDQNDE